MTTMVESITRINRYRLPFLVLCALLLITSFVYTPLLLGPFWESINNSKAEQSKVLSEDGNNSKAEQSQVLSKDGNRIITYNSVVDVNNVISSPACLPFQFQNSIRNGTHKKNDFYDHFWGEKQFKRPTRIYLLHMRKAGGTSLRKYFKKVVKSKKTSFRQFDACEGGRTKLELDDTNGDGYHSYYNNKIDHKKRRKLRRTGDYNGTALYDPSGRTLYVTSLREPIGRAISNYKYEKRFFRLPPHPCRTNVEDAINITERSTLDNFATQKSFHLKNMRTFLRETRLWACNSNCYARWVTGMYIPKNIDQSWSLSKFNTRYPVISDYYYDTMNTTTAIKSHMDNDGKDGNRNTTHTHNGTNKTTNQRILSEYGRALSNEALRLLLRYDVIIVLEWLKSDPEYARFVEDVFFGGVRGIGTPRDAYCAKAMRYKNNLLPLTIENSTLQKLQRANTIDTQLYQTLTAC